MVNPIMILLNRRGHDMTMILDKVRTRENQGITMKKYRRPVTIEFTNELVKISKYQIGVKQDKYFKWKLAELLYVYNVPAKACKNSQYAVTFYPCIRLPFCSSVWFELWVEHLYNYVFLNLQLHSFVQLQLSIQLFDGFPQEFC